MKHKDNILKLRAKGKSYNEIAKILRCNKSTISYHCGKGQKEKTKNRCLKRGWKQVFSKKLNRFLNKPKNGTLSTSHKETIQGKIYCKYQRYVKEKDGTRNNMDKLSTKKVLDKIGNNPKCYLTGTPIDLTKSNTYSFDHIIPKSRGGQNTLDNLGLICTEINYAKFDKTLEEFIKICERVLNYNGYTITKD